MKELKEAIYAITKKNSYGERDNLENAYKIFVERAYQAVLQAWCHVHGGVHCTRFYANESWKAPDVKGLDLVAVQKAVTTYMMMVKGAEPFTDLLTELHEEILLTGRRGERLGQFMTPPDLSNLVTELIMSDDDVRSIDGVKTLSEPCCGVGSMVLAPLARIARVDASKLKFMRVMLNDIDTLMCEAAALQVISNTLMHQMPLHSLMVYNCNLLTGWKKPDTLMVGLLPEEEQSEAVRLFCEFNQYLTEESRKYKKHENAVQMT